MKIKPGVRFRHFNWITMAPVLDHADMIWEEYGHECTITSGTEGEHSPNSKHYVGDAVDLRTRYFDDRTKEKIRKRLQRILGEDYDVVNEPTHMHIEYDFKG